jgi:hypothetical protein
MNPECKERYQQLELHGMPSRLTKPFLFPPPNVTWGAPSSLPDEVLRRHGSSTSNIEHAMKVAPVLSWRGGTSPAIAYIWTACREQYMKLIRRAFERLYNTKDAFIFWVDAFNSPKLLHSLPGELEESQPSAIEANVFVRSTQRRIHILGFWSQVDETLRAIKFALQLEHPVDFIVRFSEADYPLHPASWLRGRLAQDAARGKLEHVSCAAKNESFSNEAWWGWWVSPMTRLAFTCGESYGLVPGWDFPQSKLEVSLMWASGMEWNIISRRLADYAVSDHPEIARYRELMAHRMLADEIFWSTLVLSVPEFTESAAHSMTYELWAGHADSTHSPTSWDDRIARENWDELREAWEDSFSIRKIALEGSDGLLARIDDADPSPNLPHQSTSVHVKPSQSKEAGIAKVEEALPKATTLWTQPSLAEMWWRSHRAAVLVVVACLAFVTLWVFRHPVFANLPWPLAWLASPVPSHDAANVNKPALT